MGQSKHIGIIQEAVREAQRESVFFESTFDETCRVLLKPRYRTAHWLFQPPHTVVIGTEILEGAHLKKELSKIELKAYAANYYHHEMAHARFTTRRGGAFVTELEHLEIPFSLYNLFEDARVEPRYARVTGRAFQWTEYEQHRRSPSLKVEDLPEQMLFELIQSEGQAFAKGAADPLLGQVIRGYYREIVRAPSSEALVPILSKWLQDFPKAAQEIGLSDISGDLAVACLSVEAQDEFLSDCSDVGDGVSPPTAGSSEVGKEATLLGGAEGDSLSWVDWGRINEVARILMKVAGISKVSSIRTRPARKIGVKQYIRGDHRFYVQAPRRPSNPEKIVLIIDCSGSMQGTPVEHARILVGAVSAMAKAGHFKGSVLLSATQAGTATWQRLELPVAGNALPRIQAFGSGEALQATMMANLHELSRANAVYVFTDAQLTDQPIDKTLIHKKGIKTTGLYVGGKANTKNLDKYFDRYFVRDSIEDIALSLTQH